MEHFTVGAAVLLMSVFSWLAGLALAGAARERLNRAFASLCLLMAAVSLADAMALGAADAETARSWMRAEMAAWPLAVALLLRCALAYTGRLHGPGRRRAAAVQSLPALALAALNATVRNPLGLSAGGVAALRGGAPWDGFVTILTMAWGAAVDLAAVVLLVRHGRRMRDRNARRRTAYLTAAFLLPFPLGLLAQTVLPVWGVPLALTRDTSELALILCVGWAIWRYGLLAIDPSRAAEPILSVMKDAVLLLDAEGRVVYANRGALRLWSGLPRGPVGLRAEEVLGPDLARAGGMARVLGEHGAGLEVPAPSAGGAEVILRLSGVPLGGRGRRATGALLVATDISALKELEGLLLASRRMLRDALDNGEVLIVLLDSRGVIRVCNEPLARHYGVDAALLVGRDVFSLFSGELGRDRRERFTQVLATGRPSRYEEESGGRHWEHRLTAVRGAEGRVTGVTVFSLDVTARVEAQRARERLIAERNEALAKVRTLTGLIPICVHCKRIRDDRGYWRQVEQYVAEHTGAEFREGLCDDCLRAEDAGRPAAPGGGRP